MNAKGNEAGGTVPFNLSTPEGAFAIQDCAAGIYFAGLGTWTASSERALAFRTEQEEEVFAQNQALPNVRVVKRAKRP